MATAYAQAARTSAPKSANPAPARSKRPLPSLQRMLGNRRYSQERLLARTDSQSASDGMHALAAHGVAGSADSLPHLPVIQQAFGRHDLQGVKARVGGEAAQAADGIGAHAYTFGDRVAFRQPPNLRTAAHEAAHVLQQRSGVTLPGGVGRTSDRYEQHADAVANAVVDNRPVGPLLNNLGSGGSAAPAVQAKGEAESDVDAIGRAGLRAATHSQDDTLVMLDGASIVFRMLRTFFPESLDKWHFSGVGYQPDLDGIRMHRTGRNVSVTVGRTFVLDTKDRGLSSRVIEVGAAVEMLEDPNYNDVTSSMRVTKAPATWSEAIAEAGHVFQRDARFGVTAGSMSGPDPNDSFDARYWKEEGRSIEAIVEPWIATSQMVAHLDEPVPKVGGGTTRWSFDCFEGAEVERLYADWRMLSRDAFNKKNSPLKIGFMSYLFDRMQGTRNEYFKRAVQSDKKGDKPYTVGDEQMVRLPTGEYRNVIPKAPVSKTMTQTLDEAPVGSWIIWTNDDVSAKIASYKKRKAAKQPISAAEEALMAKIDPWNNENALKVSQDRYSAFPFGVVNEKAIVEGMAKIVFDPNPVPAGYIEKYIHISAISHPK